MPRVCSVCVHDRRLEIDRRLIQRVGNYTEIAEEFGLGMPAIRNHALNHLSRQLSTTYGRRELLQSTEMVDELKEVLENAKSIFHRNYTEGRDNTALKALDSIRMTLELVARIAAYIHEAKMMEERANQQTAEELHQEQDQKFLRQAISRLNNSELEMLDRLISKASGETDEVIIPEEKSPFADVECDLENPEFDRDNQRSDRSRVDMEFNRDFGEFPPRPMRRTK
jgi:hypothetical protein